LTGIKIYGRDSFKAIPLEVQRILQSLKNYRSGQGAEEFGHISDHREIARLMNQAPCSPFTIIIEEELLDPSHYWDKRYVKIKTEQIVSELDETVLRHFDREINARMAEFLKHNRDEENRYFRSVLKQYYPQAKRILRDQYKEIYPRAWKRKFTMQKISKPRKKRRQERIYAIPEPLNYWDSRNSYQQYFAIPEYKVLWQGGGGSSSQRETQSRLGFAFGLFNQTQSIPSHIFVYNKDNVLRYGDTLEKLCLAPFDMGSNYQLNHEEMRKTLHGTLRVERGSILEPIRAIEVRPFFEKGDTHEFGKI
jgi:hypothetical protein